MNFSNIDWGIVLGFIGLIGTIFGVWSYFKTHEAKEPQCCYKTFRNIVKLTKDDDLKISFKGEEVERVSTTYIFFWNKGSKPIKVEDIPETLILMFHPKNMGEPNNKLTVLEAKVVKTSRSVIHFSTNQSYRNDIDISFNFLDKYDGAVIEVKHTGDSDVVVSFSGTILGVPKGIQSKKIYTNILEHKPLLNFKFSITQTSNVKAISSIIIISIILGTLFGIIYFFPYVENLLYALAVEIALILFIGLIIVQRNLINNPPFPKSLDIEASFIDK